MFLDEIKTFPKKFSELFTKTPDKKQNITVVTDAVDNIDLSSLVAKIQQALPIDGSVFTGEFSTSTPQSILAMNAAFADAVSPFFDYYTTMCGIPRVRRLGTKKDWESIEAKIGVWIKLFSSKAKDVDNVIEWLNRAQQIIQQIHTRNDLEFWSKIFSICNCGSGHMDDAQGWLVGLYRSATPDPGWIHHGPSFFKMPSHISIVNWTNVETERKFSLYTGLLWRFAFTISFAP
jgi:hypothetical protein